MMSSIAPVWLAYIHREVYAAILHSWVPHGQKGELARRAGITQPYLSYLCSLNPNASTVRLPSPEVAERLAAALPAPAEIKQSLLENMALARTHAAEANYRIRERVTHHEVSELLKEIGSAHRHATFGTAVAQTRRAYHVVRDASASAVSRLSPHRYPAAFAQLCLYLHDAQCVLDRADDALRHAKLAHLVLTYSDDFEVDFSQEAIDNLRINAVRGQLVAYHNLHLYGKAPQLYEEACATRAYRNSRDFWAPLVARDRLNALARTPRFSIREARRLAYTIREICERTGDGFTRMLGNEAWTRCLIAHAEWAPARRIILDEIEHLPALPYAGPLHRALLFKSAAQLAWQTKERDEWRHWAFEAVSLMQTAGLIHQLHEMNRHYGSALHVILDSIP